MFYTCRKRLMKMVRLSPKNRTIWWRVDLPGQKGNEVGLQRDVIIQQRNGKRNVVRIGCRTCRWSSRKKENQVSIKTANPAVTTHFVPGRTNVRPIVLQPLGQFSIFYTRRKCLMKAVRLSLKSYDLVEIWLTWSEGDEVELQRDVIIQQHNRKRNVVRRGCKARHWSFGKKKKHKLA